MAEWDDDMKAVMELVVVHDVSDPTQMAARLGWSRDRLDAAQRRLFADIRKHCDDVEILANYVSSQEGNPGIGAIGRSLGWPKKRVRAAFDEMERRSRAILGDDFDQIAFEMIEAVKSGATLPKPKRSFLNSN